MSRGLEWKRWCLPEWIQATRVATGRYGNVALEKIKRLISHSGHRWEAKEHGKDEGEAEQKENKRRNRFPSERTMAALDTILQNSCKGGNTSLGYFAYISKRPWLKIWTFITMKNELKHPQYVTVLESSMVWTYAIVRKGNRTDPFQSLL